MISPQISSKIWPAIKFYIQDNLLLNSKAFFHSPPFSGQSKCASQTTALHHPGAGSNAESRSASVNRTPGTPVRWRGSAGQPLSQRLRGPRPIWPFFLGMCFQSKVWGLSLSWSLLGTLLGSDISSGPCQFKTCAFLHIWKFFFLYFSGFICVSVGSVPSFLGWSSIPLSLSLYFSSLGFSELRSEKFPQTYPSAPMLDF